MTNKVVLNNLDHPDLKVTPRHAPEFGDSINQTLIFPTEFAEVQREYPIFFRKDPEGAFQAVALLGLDRDENLFLDEQGWQASYIPALQQRGPFSIAVREQEVGGEIRPEPMIHVDLDDPRIGTEEGQPLFLPHGGNAPYLEYVAGLLRTIYQGLEVAPSMFSAFEEAGLIEQVAVEIMLSETEKYDLPNLYTIGQDKLARLEGDALVRLHRSNFLLAAFLAVTSLANVNRLIELKNRKRSIR